MDDYLVSVLAKQRTVDAVREAEACRAAAQSRAPRRAVRLVLGQALLKLGARLVRGTDRYQSGGGEVTQACPAPPPPPSSPPGAPPRPPPPRGGPLKNSPLFSP